MTRSAYQISPIWSDSRLRRSKIRFPRIQDYLRVTRPSQITRDISFPDGSDDGHEERVRGNQREREPVTIILASHTRVATTHTTNMASASALAGAFTTFGVSANRAAAKKTNVVAKKVRVEMPSVPNKSTRSSTSSFPRVARARRWLVRPAISTARAFAAGAIDGDRCRTRDRAIARRARLGRERPRSVLVARLFSSPTGQFLTRGLPTRDASNARSPRLFSALDPQAFSARSAVRSVKRDLTVRLRAAPRGPRTSPNTTRYVLPPSVLSVSEKNGTGLDLSSRRAAGRALGPDPARGGSGRGSTRPRVRVDPTLRADHTVEIPPPFPLVQLALRLTR